MNTQSTQNTKYTVANSLLCALLLPLYRHDEEEPWSGSTATTVAARCWQQHGMQICAFSFAFAKD